MATRFERPSVTLRIPAQPGLVARIPAGIYPSDDDFFEFCQANRDWQIERTADGELLVMTPSGGESARRGGEVFRQLANWARQDRTGIAFDASGGFTLPNTAVRAPDAAWVLRSRLAALTSRQRERFLPLAPDFAVEVRSPSDTLRDARAKMEEYIANGTRLGWLIDPISARAFAYRPHKDVEELDRPAQLAGDPVLPGFTLDLSEIWTVDL